MLLGRPYGVLQVKNVQRGENYYYRVRSLREDKGARMRRVRRVFTTRIRLVSGAPKEQRRYGGKLGSGWALSENTGELSAEIR